LGTFQINNWAYETEADKPISLGTVPESSHTALGLGALALGAAGIRRWRRQRESRS
jgi:MYXO-CTERM domain-containing protein